MKNKKLFAILTLVCFMFTLMPVAAFAAIDAQNSYVYVDETDVDKMDEVEVTIDAEGAQGGDTVYVWFEAKTNVPSSNFVKADGSAYEDASGNPIHIAEVTVNANGYATLDAYFKVAGEYEVHAASKSPADKYDANGTKGYDTWADAVASISDYEFDTEADDVVTVSSDSAKTSDYVVSNVAVTNTINGNAAAKETSAPAAGYYEDGDTIVIELTEAEANGIDEVDVQFNVYEEYDETNKAFGDDVYATGVEIDSTSKVTISDVKAKRTGVVSFTATIEKVGTHKVTVEIDGFEVTVKFVATEGEAEEIEVDYVSANPINIDGAWNGDKFENQLRLNIYDENGNKLVNNTTSGFDKALDNDTNYVAIVEQPADSDLENDDFELVWSDKKAAWTIGFVGGAEIEEEGDYTFKVSLNDGTSVKATLTVMESGDYVALRVLFDTNSVQLGAKITASDVSWLDANKVATSAVKDVTFTASGSAIKDVNGTTIEVKDDEKYIGSTIEVTVVDEENDLIATTTLTVASEAKELVFDVPAVPVDTTRTINVKLVDENGKTVGLDATTSQAYVVVMEKPAGSDVDASATNLKENKGTFDITFSADTVGIVKLQAVLKATVDNVVRYYTGVVEIPVGAAGVEDVVVMSIGSSELIVNDTIVTIPAPAVIKESRTFVPFRAVGEAFGAEVEWDAATQSVTAELDGVTVVLTIGSKTYTVNGVEKTADVAPYIAGDGYTMVPARFIAEAFGYNVEFTTNPNGTVADILFRG